MGASYKKRIQQAKTRLDKEMHGFAKANGALPVDDLEAKLRAHFRPINPEYARGLAEHYGS